MFEAEVSALKDMLEGMSENIKVDIAEKDFDFISVVKENINNEQFKEVMDIIKVKIDEIENDMYKRRNRGKSRNSENVINKIIEFTKKLYKVLFETNERVKGIERELIVVIPGDSGIKQCRVVQEILKINDVKNNKGEEIKFYYFPISKLKEANPPEDKEMLSPYIKESLDIPISGPDTDIKKLYMIIDFNDSGEGVINLKQIILNDYVEEPVKQNKPFVSVNGGKEWGKLLIPDYDILINANNNERCTNQFMPHWQPNPTKLQRVDNFTFCNIVIMSIYYFYLKQMIDLKKELYNKALTAKYDDIDIKKKLYLVDISLTSGGKNSNRKKTSRKKTSRRKYKRKSKRKSRRKSRSKKRTKINLK